MIDRRHCMFGAAAAGGALIAGASGAAPRMAAKPFFARHMLPLGLQLYSLAPDLDADFDGTLAKLHAIGIRSVETAGFHGRSPAQLRASFDRAGLRCTSAHIQARANGNGPSLDGDFDALARDLHVVGITNVVMPSPPLPNRPKSSEGFAAAITKLTQDDWHRVADLLNTAGKALRQRGLAVSYHNHNPEFAPHDWGTAFDLLMRETDPSSVSFEMDAGWVAAAGIDPIALLRAHPHRFTQMHVKDIKASTVTNYVVEQDPTEVGSGKMDWHAILPAAYADGVRGFFIEQEPPFAGPRIDAIAKSATYLLALKTA
ncbi:sugar phosphate isomerase/epimerase family protein [Sphingomonas nostoxanthinifaciens]|uniref:sugar phosphate isomerase/epimerase family protein n=1 Tax=Sphingomonas nostoxanthinifaciens TaxID=2872652 RepID=UPI001CC21C46|nr:sugar phosphate isomerase/epimerase [Sphingomonas nostoxanthinifaciens]UAK23714.1 sugar phosphate isomerase/epimerase [Sphingomonas nostoxanthinifaciens]